MRSFYGYEMGGLSRSLFGIGIGLGTVILFHLIRQFLRRKPLPPPSTDDDTQPLSTGGQDEGVLAGGQLDGENEGDEVSSILSLPESGFDFVSNPDLDFDDELATSILSDNDSIESASELQRQAGEETGSGEHDAKVRRRRLGTFKEMGVVDLKSENADSKIRAIDSNVNLESSNFSVTSCDFDSRSSDDCALPTELCRDASFSSNQQQGLVEPGDVDGELSTTSQDQASISMVDRSSVLDSILRNRNASPNRTFQSHILEQFDHSTPDVRGSLSWLPRTSWMFAPSNFTIDCDVPPEKSVSCLDCRRDFPTASRSCMSIDLGEMSSISSYVAEMVDEGKLDCDAMNNMEKLEVELYDIQVEMREMEKRVGKLQSCDILQRYNICHVDFGADSIDDGFEVLPSPRRSSLCDLHRMSTVEPEASLVWDYDFDVDVGNDTFDVTSTSDFDNESVGQLESFVRYRSQKVARDVFRRSGLSMSDAASRLSRSDSIFGCLKPSCDDETEQKSCSLYDVNRRLSGQFLIPSLSD